MTTLANGLLATANTGDHVELRGLVDELGRRSYDANMGLRVPGRFDGELWRHLDEAGLTRLTSTPDVGAGPSELAVVLYGVARHAGAVPLAETDALAGWLGQRAGIELPEGPLTVAIASADIDDPRITGTAFDVPWARRCAILLAVRGPGGLRVGIPDADSVTVREHHNLAGEPRDEVTFDIAADELRLVDQTVATELVRRGAWSRCIQIVGALDAAAALAVDHTRQRQQFGRSLSAFQSVQQSLAGMVGEIETARAAVDLAVAAAADHGFSSVHTDIAVTVAKVAVGRAVEPVTTTAHQLHGAIGVTGEHPLGLFTMRALSWMSDYGTTNAFARALGRISLSAEDPWDLVTG